MPPIFRGVFLLALVAVPLQSAWAVSAEVRSACRHDYRMYCSAHPVGSSALRQCMRRADKKLSRACVNALVAADEISAKELKRRRRAAGVR
jgi:hypothetical protein